MNKSKMLHHTNIETATKRHTVLISIPKIIFIIVITILITTITVFAATGTSDAPNAPGLTSSYTMEDIYIRLINGSTGTQSTFSEPAVAPGIGTMHDLNDIMAAAPALDNTDGATSADVLNSKTFWGLSNGEWGLQTGNIPNGSHISGANGLVTFDIPNGYYAGKTATASDSDLLSANIKSGVNILGVSGELHGGCTCEGTLVGTRWCDNGDGTITDMLGDNGNGICMIWLKDANCLGQKPWMNASYDDAQTAAGTLENGQCGLTDNSMVGDWRLPTKFELTYIAFGTERVNSSNMRAFVDVQPNYYWTSTTDPDYISYACRIFMGSYSRTFGSKTNNYYILPVRIKFED